jgi:hypothetical protein
MKTKTEADRHDQEPSLTHEALLFIMSMLVILLVGISANSLFSHAHISCQRMGVPIDCREVLTPNDFGYIPQLNESRLNITIRMEAS